MAVGGERLRAGIRLARSGAANVLRALLAEDLRLRALALTTITLFALVPALVVAFSFLQAFAGLDTLWRRAQDFLIANLAVGARASIEPYLEKFVRNAHATSAGVVGAAVLVASAVSLFTNVEQAMNGLWGIRQGRSWTRRALVYWAGLTLGPVLLATSLAVAHGVEAHVAASVRWSRQLASAGLTCLFFTVLYAIVPATRVRLRAALTGGVVAGLSWELAKALYALAVARFFRYSAIYGSLAAIPIFLIWLQISWTLLLFGARVAFVTQHARQLVRSEPVDGTPLGRELLAARALLEVARAYRRGDGPRTPEEVAEALRMPFEPVQEALARLTAARLLAEVASGAVLPARPLDLLTLADVRKAVSGGVPEPGAGPGEALVAGCVVGAEGAAARALGAVTYAGLCEQLDGPAAPPAEPVEPGGTLADLPRIG